MPVPAVTVHATVFQWMCRLACRASTTSGSPDSSAAPHALRQRRCCIGSIPVFRPDGAVTARLAARDCRYNALVRLLALILSVTVTGPPVASLACDWACAAKHQIVATGSGCHEHGTDTSTPIMARGHQCHEVSSAPDSVLTNTPMPTAVLAVTGTSLSVESLTSAPDRSGTDFHSPPEAPPRLSIPLRI